MLVYIAVLMPVLILLCGLGVDMGAMETQKLQMQNAADAAAIGAEMELERGTGNYVSAGLGDAALNGFTNGVNGATVTVTLGTGTSPSYGAQTVQVAITQPARTYFLGAMDTSFASVATTAVAVRPPCSFFSGASGLTPYSLSVAGVLAFSSACPYYISPGMSAFGTIMAGAGEQITGPASSSSLLLSYLAPPPQYNAPKLADPLAYLAEPSFTGCTQTGATYSNKFGIALNPGVYCNGLQITGSDLSLKPGLYIVTGGMKITSSNVSGTGVTFFFTSGGGASYGRVQIVSSNVSLSAPTSSVGGSIPGILVFGDRNWVHTVAQDFLVESSNMAGNGIWYTTGTGIALIGTLWSAADYLAFDTDNLTVTASILETTSNYSAIAGGNPMQLTGGLVQ